MSDDFYEDFLTRFLEERRKEFWTKKRFFAYTFIQKLHQQGLVALVGKRSELFAYLENQVPEPVPAIWQSSIELPEEYFDLEKSTRSPSDHIDIKITAQDAEEYAQRYEEIVDEFKEKTPDTLGDEIYTQWKERAAKIVGSETVDNSWMQARILEYWGEALDLLELLIVTSLNIGDEFNERYRKSASFTQVSHVLARLDARASQVSQEIVYLLRGGYADGAHARWRTLHELDVIIEYIFEHGDEMAQRYSDHGVVEVYKTRDMYQRDAALLGETPMPEDSYAEIAEEYQRVISLYGARFKDTYGWAASPGMDRGGRERNPTFDMLEEEVELKHVRFFYRMANANVHAGVRGVQYRLGAWEFADDLMTGPSFFGLGVPARNTAYSMTRIMITLLASQQGLTNEANKRAFRTLFVEVSRAFYAAQRELDRIDYLHTLSKELFEAHAKKDAEETKRLTEELERGGATIEYGRRGRIKGVTFPKKVYEIEENEETE